MSASESSPLDGTATESLAPLPGVLRAITSLAARPVRFVAFWIATLLPFTYVPLLVSGAITSHLLSFVGVVGVNAVAFVVGHGHNRRE